MARCAACVSSARSSDFFSPSLHFNCRGLHLGPDSAIQQSVDFSSLGEYADRRLVRFPPNSSPLAADTIGGIWSDENVSATDDW